MEFRQWGNKTNLHANKTLRKDWHQVIKGCKAALPHRVFSRGWRSHKPAGETKKTTADDNLITMS